jgi:FkbH-like protein
MYNVRKRREDLRKSISSLDDFLKSLEMKVIIKHADNLALPRILRMINKTNQFNLTTRRYTDTEIRKMKEAKNKFEVYSIQICDKFGEEGIVGVAIIDKQPKIWTLDSFLLSCRVIGRKIETAFLARIVSDAKEQGASTIIGEYVPTPKNAPVKDFYSSHGFEELAKEGNVYRWKLDLTKNTVNVPDWMEVKNE